VRGAATAREARPSESIGKINDDLNNLANDRGDIFRCCIGQVKMGYAKTMSIQQHEGDERQADISMGSRAFLRRTLVPMIRAFASAWQGSGAGMATARVAKEMRAKRAILMGENMAESWRRRARQDKESGRSKS